MQIPCVYLPGPAPAVSVANTYIEFSVRSLILQFLNYIVQFLLYYVCTYLLTHAAVNSKIIELLSTVHNTLCMYIDLPLLKLILLLLNYIVQFSMHPA